jgi:hypothetical protein
LIVELDIALAASAFTNDLLDIPSNIKRPSMRSHQIMV